jgi:hypothetical protein
VDIFLQLNNSNKVRNNYMNYGKGAGAGVVTTAGVTTGAALLPNTGGNLVVEVAIAVAAGLVVWGVLYLRARA